MTRNIFLSASLPEGASVTITKTITKKIGEVVEEWIVGKECRLIWGGHPPIVQTEDGMRVTHYVDVSEQVKAMGAEERAIPVLEHVLRNRRVTNGEVQKLLSVSKPTATRLLQKLDAVLELVGHGVGSYYKIRNY